MSIWKTLFIMIDLKTYTVGEAEYIDDIPKNPNEVHAAFVLATIGNCELDTVDPSPALVSLVQFEVPKNCLNHQT